MPKNKYRDANLGGKKTRKLSASEQEKMNKLLPQFNKFGEDVDKRFEDAYKRKALKPPTLKEKRETYHKKVEKRRSEMVASRKKKRYGGSVSYGNSPSGGVKGYSKNYPGMGGDDE